MLVAREREPGVDHEAAASALDHRHVLAHLAEAAERDDADADQLIETQCMVTGGRGAEALAGTSSPRRSRQDRTCSISSSVASTSGSRRPPTSWPSRLSAALIGDRVRDDLQEVVGRLQLVVYAPRLDVVSGLVQADHLLHLRADDVRVHADTADAADLEERVDEVVVARVEGEAGLLDDEARLDEIVVRLLDGFHRLDLGELRHRLRLDVDDDPAGDVVDDHGLVAERRRSP